MRRGIKQIFPTFTEGVEQAVAGPRIAGNLL
jgi:hypothetical protein